MLKLQKVKKVNFFKGFLKKICLDFIDIIGVYQSKEDVERKILVFGLCELDNPLLSYGCLSKIFAIQALRDKKCIVSHM